MRRVPLQGTLPLGSKDKVLHRQWRERASGQKVRPGPGRPKKKGAGPSHLRRPELRQKSVLHVTLKATSRVPNLRTRRRYAVVRDAFVRYCAQHELGFRLVHFAVLSNHVHFVVEADSKHALSMGLQKLLHSISRRLNALSLFEHGQRQSTKGGSYRSLPGWLGRVFAERYHAHLLRTPTEMHNAVRYVRTNADRHYTAAGARSGSPDPFSSFAERAVPTGGDAQAPPTCEPRNGLLRRICRAQASPR